MAARGAGATGGRRGEEEEELGRETRVGLKPAGFYLRGANISTAKHISILSPSVSIKATTNDKSAAVKPRTGVSRGPDPGVQNKNSSYKRLPFVLAGLC